MANCSPPGAAAARGLPLLVDAEQSWFQSWIDYAVLLMSVRYNRTRPVVYNTYQLYLADTLQRMRADLGDWLTAKFMMPILVFASRASFCVVAQPVPEPLLTAIQTALASRATS